MFSVIRLRQGENATIVYAHIANKIQWSLTKNKTVVKVDVLHYLFSFPVTKGFDPWEDVLNYGFGVSGLSSSFLV